jgi:hypothetical protein
MKIYRNGLYIILFRNSTVYKSLLFNINLKSIYMKIYIEMMVLYKIKNFSSLMVKQSAVN